MSAFRAPPPGEPLVAMQLPFLRGIDRHTGALRWQIEVGGLTNGRMLAIQAGFFVLAERRLLRIDRMSGKILGEVKLPLEPDAILFDGECFIVSNVPEIAAVDLQGRVRWAALLEPGTMHGTYQCRDAQGHVLWKDEYRPGPISASSGLALGGLVVQPDLKRKM